MYVVTSVQTIHPFTLFSSPSAWKLLSFLYPSPPTPTSLSTVFMCHSPCVIPPQYNPSWGPPVHSPPPPPPPKTTTHTLFGCNFPRVFDEALTHHAESTSPLSDWLGGLGNCFIARHGRWIKKKKEKKSIPDLNPDRNHSKPITMSGQMPQHHHFAPLERCP